jgi:hypothetical protein
LFMWDVPISPTLSSRLNSVIATGTDHREGDDLWSGAGGPFYISRSLRNLEWGC